MIAALRALAELSRVFAGHNVRWAVVGSMASSVHGAVRTTQDVDIVLALPPGKLTPVARALSVEFAIDAELIRENFAAGRSANIFFKEDFFKVDLFPAASDPDRIAQLERAQIERIEAGGGSLSIPVSTAEDIVIAKLKWWRESGSSQRQWDDLIGIVRTSHDRLDLNYVRQWADTSGFVEALQHLLNESR